MSVRPGVGTSPWIVSDDLWDRLEPLLPQRERRFGYPGRKALPDREVPCRILYVLHTGIQWEYLPKELGFGSGTTCWRRLRDWNEAGVWQRLHEIPLAELNAASRLDRSRCVVDSSHVRALKGGTTRAPRRSTAAGPARNTTSSPTDTAPRSPSCRPAATTTTSTATRSANARHRAGHRPLRNTTRHRTGHLPVGGRETPSRHPRSSPQTRLLPDHPPTTQLIVLAVVTAR